MVEIYKTIDNLNPPHRWDFFTQKLAEYDFRTRQLCKIPTDRSQGISDKLFKFKKVYSGIASVMKLNLHRTKNQTKNQSLEWHSLHEQKVAHFN